MKRNLDSTYSFLDYVRLLWSLVITKLLFRSARIIRQPCRIRGFKNMLVGKGFTTGQYCRIEAANSDVSNKYTLIIGENVQINDSCHIAALDSVSIGDNVLIASKVYISDHDHGDFSEESLRIPPRLRELVSAPVYIEDDVWLGEGVIILKGVRIGRGSVIGAATVVTKDIPSYSLALGVPAKVVKTLDESFTKRDGNSIET